jgi:cell division protein FtsA
MENKLLFALDIGTRSVVGLVGEQRGPTIHLLAVERQEHHTRAMLDGQIHDVPEVAKVLAAVKTRLEQTCGPLKKVSVAAAGRALCTIRSKANLEVQGRGLLSANDEHTLELSAIQTAQHQLATSNTVSDSTGYYCVGYSVVSFTLDDTFLKTLVGQRGKLASVELIATFLPRQVIDSLQSAIQLADLEMDTLTLEPIAAINVLIPPTMRHLNLVLVDVGAGTSDVAITKDGSVIGYGMVPCAGDEITEAISQKYLLDFNVAEGIKRQLGSGKNKKIAFNDVLGMPHKVFTHEVIDSITSQVNELAQAIATQILTLNTAPPQAVLMVGGGSLTPLLAEALSQALDIPSARVAIRCPDTIEGIADIPTSLCTPDAVTPLGILKLSGSRTLNFVNVTLNNQSLHLFNLDHLTMADALLAAGLDIRSLHGRPGLGITVSVNNQTKFLAGSYGHPGQLQLNGEAATFTDRLKENDVITVTKGCSGVTPSPLLREIIEIPPPITVLINDRSYAIAPVLTINGIATTADTALQDRDQIVCHLPVTLDEVLQLTNTAVASTDHRYIINGTERIYSIWPNYTINEKPATAASLVKAHDVIHAASLPAPTLEELLGLSAADSESVTILFNGNSCSIPTRIHTVTVNDQPAALTDTPPDGSVIDFSSVERPQPMVSDALLAAEFNPRELSLTSRVTILLNKQTAEYTAIVKNGDAIDIIVVDSGNSPR